MKKFFETLVHKFFLLEKDPSRLAYATCLGIFIGLSPFLGLQTWLAIFFAWAFGLSIPLVFSVLYLVNNPFFTTIPIVIANYLTGYLLFTYIITVDVCAHNPSWFNWIEQKIAPFLFSYLGIQKVCFWYFMVGGVIFAILVTIPLYPVFKYLYTNLAKKYENNNTK
ncbi:MAG: DUF2062 domain-containing protein [Candidatus Babeliaceae bacterium]|nr:DUF2062 domain-containing protein [Candidatus Babeliaceae bacterium]